jgi:hypothetical protein
LFPGVRGIIAQVLIKRTIMPFKTLSESNLKTSKKGNFLAVFLKNTHFWVCSILLLKQALAKDRTISLQSS